MSTDALDDYPMIAANRGQTMAQDFVFMVFAGEPFASLEVKPIRFPVAMAMATELLSGIEQRQDASLKMALTTLWDSANLCVAEHPELAKKCLPARCCLALLLGENALEASVQILQSGRDLRNSHVVKEYNDWMNEARSKLLLADDFSNEWTEVPRSLRYRCHWSLARFCILTQQEDTAISILHEVVWLCGDDNLIPNVWLVLAGLLFKHQRAKQAMALLNDYVHRARTLFPENTEAYLAHARECEHSARYPEVRAFFQAK